MWAYPKVVLTIPKNVNLLKLGHYEKWVVSDSLFPSRWYWLVKINIFYLDTKDNAILPRIGVYIITGPKTNDAALPMHVLLGWGESAVTPTCEPSEILVGKSLWKLLAVTWHSRRNEWFSLLCSYPVCLPWPQLLHYLSVNLQQSNQSMSNIVGKVR